MIKVALLLELDQNSPRRKYIGKMLLLIQYQCGSINPFMVSLY